MTWELSFDDSPEGDAAFKEALFADKINNATCYMFTKGYSIDNLPKNADVPGGATQYAYGSHPIKMRAELVAPELFTAFREFHQQVKYGDIQSYIRANSDTSEPVIHAMRIAYMLLGRSMRSDDDKTHIQMMYGSPAGEVITDVSAYLFK